MASPRQDVMSVSNAGAFSGSRSADPISLPKHDRTPQLPTAVPNITPVSGISIRVPIYTPSASSVVIELACRYLGQLPGVMSLLWLMDITTTLKEYV